MLAITANLFATKDKHNKTNLKQMLFKGWSYNKISDLMPEKKQMRSPSGMAGLVRYDEGNTSVIKLKPLHVVGITLALIVLEAVLFFMVPA